MATGTSIELALLLRAARLHLPMTHHQSRNFMIFHEIVIGGGDNGSDIAKAGGPINVAPTHRHSEMRAITLEIIFHAARQTNRAVVPLALLISRAINFDGDFLGSICYFMRGLKTNALGENEKKIAMFTESMKWHKAPGDCRKYGEMSAVRPPDQHDA